MTTTEVMVEGEPAALIVEALQALFQDGHEENGMLRIKGRIGGDSGAALVHALGRIESELRAADMRSFMPGGARTSRTAEQRRADALVLLVERVGDALPS